MKCIILAMIFVMVSCATKVTGLKASASFSADSVKSGKAVVGGVTHSVEELDLKKQISLANTLKGQILEERPYYNVAGAGILLKQLGEKKYAELVKEIETTNVLSQDSLKLIKSKLPKQRYVIFARVESDDVSNDRQSRAQTDSSGESNGNTSITTVATREVVVSFRVFDLNEMNTAWDGSIKKVRSNRLEYTQVRENGLVSLVKVIKGTAEVAQDDQYPFPKAPTLKSVLEAAFNGFAENLPEEA